MSINVFFVQYRQAACKRVNSISVDNVGSLFSCMTVSRAADWIKFNPKLLLDESNLNQFIGAGSSMA